MGCALHFSSSPVPVPARTLHCLFFGHAGECSLNCCASLHWRMEIRGDIHLQPKQPTLHNLPTYLPFSVPTHAQWRMCACGPSSAPAAFLDGRGRQGRYLASPSWNDKKARSPSHLLARLLAPLMHHSHYLNYVEEYLKNSQNSGKPGRNYKTTTELMVHLPHQS